MNFVTIKKEPNILLFEEKFNQQEWNRFYASNDIYEALYKFIWAIHGLHGDVFLIQIYIQ